MGFSGETAQKDKLKIIYTLCEARIPITVQLMSSFLDIDEITIVEILTTWSQFLKIEFLNGQNHYSFYHRSFAEFLNKKEIIKFSGLNIKDINKTISNILWDNFHEDGLSVRTKLEFKKPEILLYAIELLPYHLFKAHNFKNLYQILTDIEFLELKTELFSVFNLLEDFLLARKIQIDECDRKRLMLIEEAIRRNINFLFINPNTLFQCLWNNCWWYDCPELSKFIDYRKMFDFFKNYKNETPSIDLYLLIEKWREQKKKGDDFFWLKTLTPPTTPLGGYLDQTISGHSDSVLSIDVNEEAGLLASGSIDKTFRIWDLQNGQLYWCIQMDRWVAAVKFSPCGKFVALGLDSVSVFFDPAIQLWDIQKNEIIKSINGHFGRILSLAFSPCGNYIVSGSEDRTARIWNVRNGNQISCFDYDAPVNIVDWSKDGEKILCVSTISDHFTKEGQAKRTEMMNLSLSHIFSDEKNGKTSPLKLITVLDFKEKKTLFNK